MSVDAIKTIKIHNWKWSEAKCRSHAQKFIDLIQAKYPVGIEDTDNETYFVLPGMEHVTKKQPVVSYNPSAGEWELQTRDLFVELKNN